MPTPPSSSPARSDDDALPRRLGLWSAVAIVIGSVIGSGIFRTPAGVAERLPGPGVMLALWAVGGLFALCGTLTLAEVGSAIPRTGGVYAYLREGWGRLTGFLFGWAEFVVIRAAALGAISMTFAEYFLRVLGYNPAEAPYSDWRHYIAALAIALTSAFNIAGIRYGAIVQILTTIAKYGGLLFIVLLAFVLGGGTGVAEGAAAVCTPGTPRATLGVGAFGLALISVLWAFDGWADLTFIGGEVRDPRRNLPRALITGSVLVLVIYLLANLAYLNVLTYDEIRCSPLVAAEVAERLIGRPGLGFVAATVMLSTFGTLNASLLTAPRIFFAMADDGLFFRKVASVHPRFETPWVAIGLAALLGIGWVLVRTFEQLADAFVTAIIPFYALGVAAVFVLRRRPGYDPSFRVPGYPVVPALFVLATLFILGNAIWDPTSRGPTLVTLGLVAAGVPVYYLTVGRRR
jgi:basic amino acid/polyamine antiporter, APA family